MPPDQPTEPSATPPPPPPEPPMSATVIGGSISGGPPRQIHVSDIARLPVPGNAEFALWLFLEIVFSLIWWFNDDVNASYWMVITAALTFGYFISRGVAKASRVLEQ
jgi:hypothetical protein